MAAHQAYHIAHVAHTSNMCLCQATDKSFEEKLKANHLGKSPTFQKPKPGKSSIIVFWIHFD